MFEFKEQYLSVLAQGGGVVAVVVVVLAFLKKDKDTLRALQSITDKFTEEIKEAKDSFQNQISRSNTQMQGVISRFSTMSRETVGVLHELKKVNGDQTEAIKKLSKELQEERYNYAITRQRREDARE